MLQECRLKLYNHLWNAKHSQKKSGKKIHFLKLQNVFLKKNISWHLLISNLITFFISYSFQKLKCYRSAIWSFTNHLWTLIATEKHKRKLLHVQEPALKLFAALNTNNNRVTWRDTFACSRTICNVWCSVFLSSWPPLLLRVITFSFLIWFWWLLVYQMCQEEGVQVLFEHQEQLSPTLGSSLSWVLKCSVTSQSTLRQKFLSMGIAGIGKKQVSISLDFPLESGSLEWFACLHYQKVASDIFLFDTNTSIWIASSSVKPLVFTFMATISRWTLRDIRSNVKTQVSDPKPPAVHKTAVGCSSPLVWHIDKPLMYTPGPFELCENIVCDDGINSNTKTQSYTQPELAYKFWLQNNCKETWYSNLKYTMQEVRW